MNLTIEKPINTHKLSDLKPGTVFQLNSEGLGSKFMLLANYPDLIAPTTKTTAKFVYCTLADDTMPFTIFSTQSDAIVAVIGMVVDNDALKDE